MNACEHCGASFIPYRSHQRFCTKRCRDRAGVQRIGRKYYPLSTNEGHPALAHKVLSHLRRSPSGCLEYTGPTNGVGYGVVCVHRVRGYVHRVVYANTFGPIPPGLVIDHLCKNPICAEPLHLEAVTQGENVRRGAKALQTHCLNGHPFDDTNTLRDALGCRRCRACRNERERNRRARMKEFA